MQVVDQYNALRGKQLSPAAWLLAACLKPNNYTHP